ncbi:uncharacterized protein LAESUDRAFT_757515 [Laetiporus sulphureus 93-53]|uniref:Uncharacterized protein n=1 Tax=Laetiporus sulphureus 93-53 TaxID=1314785 RepID=A0A165FDR2_9APHY|nr:uncharacterized protein LAESUDRAFT_757515 [Laetiporus sulphureus 93-53]KZT08815.1 hypothetical protein LAESUDRAFT_757515 [Laetiporus sulphureus 93-53]
MFVDGRAARWLNFFRFTGQVVWTVNLILFSYLLDRPFSGHELKIGRIAPGELTLYDVRYSGALYGRDYTYTFSAPSISIRYHVPKPSNQRWLTFTAYDIVYRSTTCDVSVVSLDVTFWVFPYLFKRTAGPWISVVLDGFCVRVYRSSATPYWIRRLRENLIGAILKGQIFRCDDFKTTVRFAGVSDPLTSKKAEKHRKSPMGSPSKDGSESESDDGHDSSDSSSDERESDGIANGLDQANHSDRPPPFLNADTDELRVTASTQRLHIDNGEGRLYTFGAVDAQLRRDWDTDRGSFVMIAKEGRWVRVHWPYQREWTPWWSQVFTSIAQFPLDLFRVLDLPMRTVDLFVPRADITFDEFRIRDASLMKQVFATAREKTAQFNINFGDMIFDTIIHAFIQQ